MATIEREIRVSSERPWYSSVMLEYSVLVQALGTAKKPHIVTLVFVSLLDTATSIPGHERLNSVPRRERLKNVPNHEGLAENKQCTLHTCTT